MQLILQPFLLVMIPDPWLLKKNSCRPAQHKNHTANAEVRYLGGHKMTYQDRVTCSVMLNFVVNISVLLEYRPQQV